MGVVDEYPEKSVNVKSLLATTYHITKRNRHVERVVKIRGCSTLTGHSKWTLDFLLLAGYTLPAVQFLGVPADNSVHCLPESDLGGNTCLCHCCQDGLCSQDIAGVECSGWVCWRVLCSTKAHARLVSSKH